MRTHRESAQRGGERTVAAVVAALANCAKSQTARSRTPHACRVGGAVPVAIRELELALVLELELGLAAWEVQCPSPSEVGGGI